jgi:uncharacterized cupin superfamily protein
MSRLTEYRHPSPRYVAYSGHVPAGPWTWDGTEVRRRQYRRAGSGWMRTAVVERTAGEWRWRVEEWHGERVYIIARGVRPALFPEMLQPFADLAARTKV